MKLPEPMLAQPGRRALSELIEDGGWIFEEKIDGIRVLAGYDGDKLWLRSRGGHWLHDTFPEVGRSIHPVGTGTWIVDAELQLRGQLAIGESTRTLQLRHLMARANQTRVSPNFPSHTPASGVLTAYDCLMLDGVVLMGLPLVQRADTLTALVTGRGLPFHLVRTGPAQVLLHETREAGREGIMAKRRDSRYTPGKRSSAWLKYKHTYTLHCIAYGYTESTNRQRAFGALKLAVVTEQGVARPIGEVGSGMSDFEMAQLQKLVAGQRFPVVEVSCMGRTEGGLREPVFVKTLLDLDPLSATDEQLKGLPTF